MTDYISRQAAIEELKNDKIDISEPYRAIYIATGNLEKVESVNMACDRHVEMLEQLPSADVRENVRGEWFSMFGHCVCMFCGYKGSPIQTNFCPNCGADMREVQDGI